MPVEFSFHPSHLKGLVRALEVRIGETSGPPVRLDNQKYLAALKYYNETRAAVDIPKFSSLERLSGMVPLVEKEGLLDALCECVVGSNKSVSLDPFVSFYFDNYKNQNLRKLLQQKVPSFEKETDEWVLWKQNAGVLFGEKPVSRIIQSVIQNSISIVEIKKWFGLSGPVRIIDEVLLELIDGGFFQSYISRLPLEEIISLLENPDFLKTHTPTWNYALPRFLPEAKELKLSHDRDHELFSRARIKLKPPESTKWFALREEARAAYQEWSIGSRLELFFSEEGGENDRIAFWKTQLKHIDDVLEVETKKGIEAFKITIGRYDFVEFKDSGAIYVYEKDSFLIPSKVKKLGDLKDKTKIVNAKKSQYDGQGWIPHWGAQSAEGSKWERRVLQLIREAKR